MPTRDEILTELLDALDRAVQGSSVDSKRVDELKTALL